MQRSVKPQRNLTALSVELQAVVLLSQVEELQWCDLGLTDTSLNLKVMDLLVVTATVKTAQSQCQRLRQNYSRSLAWVAPDPVIGQKFSVSNSISLGMLTLTPLRWENCSLEVCVLFCFDFF